MTENTWLDRLNQSRDRIETLRNQFLAEAKREVSEVFAEFFIQNPATESVYWTQYDDCIGNVFRVKCGTSERLSEFISDHEDLFFNLFGYGVVVIASKTGFEVKGRE